MNIIIVSKEILEQLEVKESDFSNKKENIQMSEDGVVDQIKELIAVTESFMVGNYENYHDRDKKALECAIAAIKAGKDKEILDKNIEVMGELLKELKNVTIEPKEKVEIITTLSKEIRKCINMKDFMSVYNRHREDEGITC